MAQPFKLPEWVDDLFLIFTLAYRHKWAAETDDVEIATKHLWARKLQGLDGKIIMETADECISVFASWPPTPGEFLEIAISKARRAQEKRENSARVRESNIFMGRKANPEIAKLELARIKEIIRPKGMG